MESMISNYFPPIFANSVSAVFYGYLGNSDVDRLVLYIRSVGQGTKVQNSSKCFDAMH